jgi:hypothetical protein
VRVTAARAIRQGKKLWASRCKSYSAIKSLGERVAGQVGKVSPYVEPLGCKDSQSAMSRLKDRDSAFPGLMLVYTVQEFALVKFPASRASTL